MFASIKRICRAGWVSFARNKGLSAATIFVMITTLLLATSLFLARGAGQLLIASLEEKVDISVYFKKDSREDDILKIKDELAKIPDVRNIEYVSERNALDEFIQKHKDEQILLESINQVGGNPFLASLNIKAWQSAQYENIVNFFQKDSFKDLVEKIDYGQRKSIIEKLFSITSRTSQAGIIASIILAVVAVLVAFNTVRLAIFNHKEEISIMRLVGASNWFIRGPFIIQGMISGFFAAIIAGIVSAVSCYFFTPNVETLLPGFNLFNYFISNLSIIILGQFAIGIFLGIIASLVAIGRHLEV